MNQISDGWSLFSWQDQDIQMLHFPKLTLWCNWVLCELCLFKDDMKFLGNEKTTWDFQNLEALRSIVFSFGGGQKMWILGGSSDPRNRGTYLIGIPGLGKPAVCSGPTLCTLVSLDCLLGFSESAAQRASDNNHQCLMLILYGSKDKLRTCLTSAFCASWWEQHRTIYWYLWHEYGACWDMSQMRMQHCFCNDRKWLSSTFHSS